MCLKFDLSYVGDIFFKIFYFLVFMILDKAEKIDMHI